MQHWTRSVLSEQSYGIWDVLHCSHSMYVQIAYLVPFVRVLWLQMLREAKEKAENVARYKCEEVGHGCCGNAMCQ